jgi:hypothetical protein
MMWISRCYQPSPASGWLGQTFVFKSLAFLANQYHYRIARKARLSLGLSAGQIADYYNPAPVLLDDSIIQTLV